MAAAFRDASDAHFMKTSEAAILTGTASWHNGGLLVLYPKLQVKLVYREGRSLKIKGTIVYRHRDFKGLK